jgi:hypothetical protein
LLINFFNKFISELEELKRGYAQRILGGSFSSLDDYKFVAGKLNGIVEAEEFFRTSYKNFFDLGSVRVNIVGDEEDGDS